MMAVAGYELKEKLDFIGLSEEWIMNFCIRYWADKYYITDKMRLHLALMKSEGMYLYWGQFCCYI